MAVRQRVYLVLGIVNVGLGAAGIVLPLLPTTPFLLLAAYLFARSSERWHRWLLHHRQLGPYIHAFRNKTGLTAVQKIRIVSSFTVVMAVSVYFTPLPPVKWLLVAIWAFWIFMVLRTPTAVAPATSPTPTL